MQEAIDFYNRLVAGDEGAALEQYAYIEREMISQNVRFAGTGMRTLLRPHLISQEQEHILRAVTESILVPQPFNFDG